MSNTCTTEPVEAKEIIVSPNIIGTAILLEGMKPSKEGRAIVLDNQICYGRKHPACKQPLGNKGITCIKELITCSECIEYLKTK